MVLNHRNYRNQLRLELYNIIYIPFPLSASSSVSRTFITLKYQENRPHWVNSLELWPLPRLGDFPQNDEYKNLALFHYENLLITAAKNPQTWYSDSKDYNKLIDFLTIPDRENYAANIFKNGFTVTNIEGGND